MCITKEQIELLIYLCAKTNYSIPDFGLISTHGAQNLITQLKTRYQELQKTRANIGALKDQLNDIDTEIQRLIELKKKTQDTLQSICTHYDYDLHSTKTESNKGIKQKVYEYRCRDCRYSWESRENV